MKLFRIRNCVTIFIFLLPSAYFAAKPLNIDTSLSKEKIGLHIDYLEDKNKTLKIQDLTASGRNFSWKKSEKDTIGFGYTTSAYWLRFTVKNRTNKRIKWYLELSNPHIDNLKLFVPDKNESYKKIETGDTFAFSNRPIEYRTFAFPLNTAPESLETYYLRADMVGAMRLPLHIWSPKVFHKNENSEAIFLWMYYGAIAVMIFYNLFICLVTRDVSYLYYSLYITAVAGLFMIENGYALQYLWPNTLWWQSDGKVFVYSSAIFWLIIFFRKYVGTAKLIPKRDYVLICIAALSYFPFIFAAFLEQLRLGLMLFNILVGVASIYVYYLAIYLSLSKHKNRQARYFLAAFTMFLVGALVLILNNFKVVPDNFFTLYTVQIGSFFELTLLSFALSDRIRVMKVQLQNLNLNLEQKVQERTTELEKSHQDLFRIKTKQDNDYFLTSLLIKPLGTIQYNSKFVDADALIKQKKEYDFNDSRHEIGGDYCLVDTLQLQNREYTVVLNADAMGKSLQGSGGVLVLGSLIQAYLNRSKQTTAIGESSPEIWLNNALHELDSVFKSFEGSMLMSFFLALVDNRNGFLYYIQAEHPASVLYRSREARFLPDKGRIWKLGSNLEENHPVINTMQLQPNDILVVGSDGRDDLQIVGSDGQIEWRTDTEPFLKIVEQSAAELPKIKTLLEQTGVLTDDLSLIRLEFTGENRVEKNQDTLQAELKNLMEQEDWNEAANLTAQILERDPLNNRVMGNAVEIAQYLPEKQRGIELAERLLLREPEDLETRQNLAKLYSQVGKEDKARIILEKYKDLPLQYQPTDTPPLILQ